MFADFSSEFTAIISQQLVNKLNLHLFQVTPSSMQMTLSIRHKVHSIKFFMNVYLGYSVMPGFLLLLLFIYLSIYLMCTSWCISWMTVKWLSYPILTGQHKHCSKMAEGTQQDAPQSSDSSPVNTVQKQASSRRLNKCKWNERNLKKMLKNNLPNFFLKALCSTFFFSFLKSYRTWNYSMSQGNMFWRIIIWCLSPPVFLIMKKAEKRSSISTTCCVHRNHLLKKT